MSQNFNLLYVLTALLLHFFVTTSFAQKPPNPGQSDHQLIKTHGLIHNIHFKNQCQKTLDQLNISTTCQLLDSDMVNAFALSDGTLVISLGLLQLTHNRAQLAHVLAHEYAHFAERHFQQLNAFYNKPPVFFPKKKLLKLRRKQEKDADIWANKRLESSGFDTLQIHHLWQQIAASERHHKWSDHEKLSQRIDSNALNEPLVVDETWLLLIHDLSQR